jgi:hypothetical protein
LFGCLILLGFSAKIEIPIWVITSFFAFLMLAKDIISDSIRITKSLNSIDQNNNNQEEYSTYKEGNISLDEIDTKSQEDKTVQLDSTQNQNLNNNVENLFSNTSSTTFSWKTGDAVSTLVKLPWKIIPFVVGMFVMVEGLNVTGLIDQFAKGLSYIAGNYISGVFIMCFLSAAVCNILNNQPMTILFTNILLNSNFKVSEISLKVIYFSNLVLIFLKGNMYALIMGR